MAYTAPTYAASGTSWATLGTEGLGAHAQAKLAAISSPSAASTSATELLGRLLQANQAHLALDRAKVVVDNYLNGDADKTDTKTYIYDLQCAFGAFAATLGEIGVLVDAN